MGELTVGYFLEDSAHEFLIRGIVDRVAREISFEAVRHDIRVAAGGSGTAVSHLQRFLRDQRRGLVGAFDLLVVAQDANCSSYVNKRNQLAQILQAQGYAWPAVFAIPDPHVERWYLLDPQALRYAASLDRVPQAPPYACKKHHYKEALRAAFGRVRPQLGGVEYGEDVALQMDLYRAGQADPSLGHFISDIRAELTLLRSSAAGTG